MKKLSLFLSILLIGLFSLNAFNADATIVISSITFIPLTSDPGTAAIGTFTVSNTDDVPISVLLSSLILTRTGGTETITAPLMSPSQISVGDTPVPVSFTVNVPATRAGSYTSTIEARDPSNNVVLAAQTYSLAVNQKAILDITGLTENRLTISGQKDQDTDAKFTIVNKGSVDLSITTAAITLVDPNVFEDDDDDAITFTFSNVPSTLAPGASQEVEITAKIDSDVDVGVYNGQLKITPTSTPAAQPKIFDLRIIVDPEICSDGRVSDGDPISSNDQGFLQVDDIEEPDSGDDFKPGDKITISGDVENTDDNDHDVIVEAILYNVDQDEVIERAESESFNVNEDDTESFDFELEVPLEDGNLDEDDAYRMYVKVFEDGDEDKNCNYDDVDDLEFNRESNQVVITRATVTPISVMCNANANFVVDVQNVGSDEDDRVSVKLVDSSLGLDWESEFFNLEKFDKSGDSATITQTFRIPSTTETGTYNVEAIVVFDGGRETDSEFITLKVDCGTGVTPGEGNVRISLLQSTVTATQGKIFGLPFELTNLMDDVQTYTIEVVVNGNWADKPQTQTVTLQPGQKTTLYSYLTPKADLSAGSYTLEIRAKQDDNVLGTETATVQIGTVSTGPTGGTTFQPSMTLGSVWRNLASSTAFWIIAIIIVFVLVIYVLSILLRPK